MAVCKFLKTVTNGQKIVCTVTLDGDKLTGEAEPGYERLLNNIMTENVFDVESQKQVSAKDDPIAWFLSLPFQYDGFYLNALISDGEERKNGRRKRTDEPPDPRLDLSSP